MASGLTVVREAIVAGLAGQGTLPPAAQWKDGQLQPPAERQDVACTWTSGTREVSGKVYIEEVRVTVRAMSATQRSRGGQRPLDPAKLEQWRDDVALNLAAIQAAIAPAWFLRPVGATIDPRLGYVDVEVAYWQDNVFKSV